MTSRQARKLRREQERKAKKAEYKAFRAANATAAGGAPSLPASVNPELLDEFTPEFLAYANSIRERIQRDVAIRKQDSSASQEPGFVSQNPRSPEKPPAQQPAPNPSRAETNRANAQHSTGPRTPAGKGASSRNSLKHGLASGTLIIPGEDPAAFDALLNDLLAEHQPANTSEQLLIHEMAQSFWLIQRALRLQNNCFTDNGVDEKRLALFLRYHTTHERAFHKALNALLKLKQSPDCKAAGARSGFVSQSRISTAETPGFVSQNPPSHLPTTPVRSAIGASAAPVTLREPKLHEPTPPTCATQVA